MIDIVNPFTEEMIKKGYVIPKFIKIEHNTLEKQFFHKYLIQAKEKTLNYINVYIPQECEDLFIIDQLKVQSHEFLKQKLILNLVFNITEDGQGHQGVVHGGYIAILLDQALGYLCQFAGGLVAYATAQLNVSYKLAMKQTNINIISLKRTYTDYIIIAKVVKFEGRKLFVKAQLFDRNDQLHCEADALFIKTSWNLENWQNFNSLLNRPSL